MYNSIIIKRKKYFLENKIEDTLRRSNFKKIPHFTIDFKNSFLVIKWSDIIHINSYIISFK